MTEETEPEERRIPPESCKNDFHDRTFSTEEEMDFSNCVFEGFADFSNSKFYGPYDVDFSNAVFLKGASFENVEFGKEWQRFFGGREITFIRDDSQTSTTFYIQEVTRTKEKINQINIIKNFRNTDELTSLIYKSSFNKIDSTNILKTFETFQKNPKKILFSHCRCGDMDVLNISKDQQEIFFKKEKEELKNLPKKKFNKAKESLEKLENLYKEQKLLDLNSKERTRIQKILCRHLEREEILNRANGKGNVIFENSYFFNQLEVNFGEALFFNEHFSFSHAIFHNQGQIFFNSIQFLNKGEIKFDLAEFHNFGNVNFTSSEFKNDNVVSFKSSKFYNLEDVGFSGAKFHNRGIVWFSAIEFHNLHYVHFIGTEFHNQDIVNFNHSRFINKTDVSFNSAIFHNLNFVSFHFAVFQNPSDVIFRSAKFSNQSYVSFNSVSFQNRDTVDFESTEFHNQGDVSFKYAQFHNQQDVSFKSAFFKSTGPVQFHQVIWLNSKNLNFDKSSFNELIDLKFLESFFLSKGSISFQGARFPKEGSCQFQRCFFAGNEIVDFLSCYFRHTTFEGGRPEWLLSEFKNFDDKTKERFRQLNIVNEKNQPLFKNVFDDNIEVLWKDLTTESAKNLTFRLTNFSGSKFDGMTLSHIELNAPKWKIFQGRKILFKEKTLRNCLGEISQFANIEDLRDLEDQYTQLKNNLEKQGNYLNAGEFHYGEQEIRMEILKRKIAWRNKFFLKSFSTLYKELSGFGERPLRSIIIFLCVWLLSALLLDSFKVGFDLNGLKSFYSFSKPDYFKTLIKLITPFSWKKELEGIYPFSWSKAFLIGSQIFLLGVQLPLMVMAIRRRFKR